MPMPMISMPMGFVLACITPFHSCIMRGSTAETAVFSPFHPPTFLRPSRTSGRNPAMIRKNCSTSL